MLRHHPFGGGGDDQQVGGPAMRITHHRTMPAADRRPDTDVAAHFSTASNAAAAVRSPLFSLKE
jgi:hypothetical protein